MCLLGSCFKQLARPEHDNLTHEVPKASREDLVLLASSSPFMMKHLNATHPESIVCTDASDNCLGAVESPISQNLHREHWRHREMRGWASHLVCKAAEHIIACASELVQARFSEDFIASWETRDAYAEGGPQRELIETWDFLEICCGPNAPLTKACIAEGF